MREASVFPKGDGKNGEVSFVFFWSRMLLSTALYSPKEDSHAGEKRERFVVLITINQLGLNTMHVCASECEI